MEKEVNLQDKQQFLGALYETNIEAAKGPIKLDKEHDVIQNMYIFDIVPEGQGVAVKGTGLAEKLVETYKSLDEFWDRTPEQIEKFPYGKLKGKWVGMTKEQLGNVITLPKSS